MTALIPDQRGMLAIWQQHAHAEFVLKDADAALATMTENPYVFLVTSGVRRAGRAAVHEFYGNKFLPNLPADLELSSLSQTFGADRIVEEMVMRFTHDIVMDWLLPGLQPTGQSAEFALVGVVQCLRRLACRAALIGLKSLGRGHAASHRPLTARLSHRS